MAWATRSLPGPPRPRPRDGGLEMRLIACPGLFDGTPNPLDFRAPEWRQGATRLPGDIQRRAIKINRRTGLLRRMCQWPLAISASR